MPPYITDIFKDFIYLFLERGERRKRETNVNVWLPLVNPLLGIWPATQACFLPGNRTRDPSVHRLALNPLSLTSQGRKIMHFTGSIHCPNPTHTHTRTHTHTQLCSQTWQILRGETARFPLEVDS